MANITNKHNLPQTLVNLATRDTYSRGKANISVTELIGSPRIRILRRRHSKEITQDVSEMVWSLMGRALHWVVEQGADESHIPEERLFHTVNGWPISGGVDLQILADAYGRELKDWKLTSAYAVMNGKSDWERQLNCYAYLVEKVKGVPVTGISIVAVIRDWNRHEAARNPDYPQAAIVVLPQNLWSMDEREAYVEERVRIHQDAERRDDWGEGIPECSEEDRWFKPGKLAVMKDGRVKALKLFDVSQREEAEAYAADNKGRVEERPGENTRCVSFCPVAPWCEQYRALQA